MKYDVIIIGGGISGTLCAIEIKKHCPDFKIAIIEKSETFHKKVGESTSDVTAMHLRRSPKLLPIATKQLAKTGLRFWFHEQSHHDLKSFFEFSSPSYKSIANGFQLNRAEFDQDLLNLSVEVGIDLYRPATVTQIETKKYQNTVTVHHMDSVKVLASSWLIDCSGRSRTLNQELKWQLENPKHQTGSIWAHFENLKAMSSWDLKKSKVLDFDTISPRFNVTGHFMRHGLWWWHIPLNDHTVSLGVVYDKNIHTESNPTILFKQLIQSDPALQALTAGANYNKLYHYPQLSYLPHTLYSPGQLTIGDSAGFIDPLFSPGIETSIQQILWIAPLLKVWSINPKKSERKFNTYQKKFIQTFIDRSFTYEEKYLVMDSYDIFSIWTQMDFVGYYFFHIFPASIFPSWLKRPIMLKGPLKLVYRFLKWRYLSIAKFRKFQNIKSKTLKHDITYSQVSIPSMPMLLAKFPEMLSVWVENYIRLEIDALIERLESKLQPMPKSGSK